MLERSVLRGREDLATDTEWDRERNNGLREDTHNNTPAVRGIVSKHGGDWYGFSEGGRIRSCLLLKTPAGCREPALLNLAAN